MNERNQALIATAQDTAELRESDARSARHEKLFRLLMESAQDVFFRYRRLPERTFEYVSPSIETLTGYTPEELYADPDGGFFLAHPDDVSKLRKALDEGDDFSVRVRWIHKNGQTVWVEQRGRIVRDARGRPEVVESVVRDVTTQVRDEERRALLESVVVNTRDAVLITEGSLYEGGPRILYVNPACEAMTGYSADELIGRTPRILHGERTDRQELDRIRRALEQGEAVRAELVNYGKDGREYLIEIDISPVRNGRGDLSHFVSVQRDITERRIHETKMERFRDFRAKLTSLSEEALGRTVTSSFLQRVLDYAVAVVPGAQAGSLLLRNADGSATFTAVHGYSRELIDLVVGPDVASTDANNEVPWIQNRYERTRDYDPKSKSLIFGSAGRAHDISASLKVPVWVDGRPRAVFNLDNFEDPRAFRDEAMDMARLFGRQVGVMLQRLDLEQVAIEEATMDRLTGLPNRHKGEKLLEDALETTRGGGGGGALCFLDVDNFKSINDTYGHAFGDDLMRAIAERLESATASNGTLARWSGDEFMVICSSIPSVDEIAPRAQHVLESFQQPLNVHGTSVPVGISMGVVAIPSDADTLDEVIQNAHIALHRAKRSGTRSFVLYESGFREAIHRRRRIEQSLRPAIDQREIHLHYQPRIDLRTERVTSVEALARWNDSELGSVSPGEFIPIAEDTGLIHDLGTLVLDQACAQAKAWLLAGTPRTVAVNLSLEQLRRGSIVEDVRNALETHGLAPQWLELEVTESAAMTDVDATIGLLFELNGLGVSLSIDDFGTAYSSLAHLKLLPIDSLKIDGSFVRDLGEDPTQTPTEASIVQAVIALGKSMNLKVIAEGVETAAQKRFLKLLGCDEAQGYLLGRPAPAFELD